MSLSYQNRDPNHDEDEPQPQGSAPPTLQHVTILTPSLLRLVGAPCPAAQPECPEGNFFRPHAEPKASPGLSLSKPPDLRSSSSLPNPNPNTKPNLRRSSSLPTGNQGSGRQGRQAPHPMPNKKSKEAEPQDSEEEEGFVERLVGLSDVEDEESIRRDPSPVPRYASAAAPARASARYAPTGVMPRGSQVGEARGARPPSLSQPGMGPWWLAICMPSC